MKVGDYVMYNEGNTIWRVEAKHPRNTYQVKNLIPHSTFWDNMEVTPDEVTVITKEVADVIRSAYEGR